MAIEIDAISTPTIGNTTWSHTVAAGSNKLLIVVTGSHNWELPSGVTYGGSAMTLYVEKNGTYRDVRIYYMVDPPAGAANVVVSGTFTSYGCVCGAISFTGVNQDDPFRGSASQAGTNYSPSLNVSSATDDLVLDMIVYWAGATPVLTEGAGQTSRLGYSCGSGKMVAECSTEAGDTTVAMSWAASGVDDSNYAQCAVSIQPSSGIDVDFTDDLSIDDDMKADSASILAEELTINDAVSATAKISSQISEDLSVDDDVRGEIWPEVMADVAVDDVLGVDVQTTIAEDMTIDDAIRGGHKLEDSISEDLSVDEVLTVDTQITVPEGTTINEEIAVQTQTGISEETAIEEKLAVSTQVLIDEDTTIDDAMSVIRHVFGDVSDAASIGDAIGVDARTAIQDGMSLNEIFEAVFKKPVYRYRVPLKATGKHLSLKFQNSTAGQNILLEDIALKLQPLMGMTRSQATQIKATGGHLTLKFRHNIADEGFHLLYMGAEIERYMAR